MLPDQIGSLSLVPSLLGLLLWLGLIVVVVRINKRLLVRIAAIVLWLIASLFVCLGAGIGANVIYDELLYQGVHNAVREQCDANYAPARNGFWFLWNDTYIWRQYSDETPSCAYESGAADWDCIC
jgi:hypothetical protein